MPEFEYSTNCTASTAEWINDMTESATAVSYKTLANRVGVDQLSSVFPVYEWGRGRAKGLRMKDDYAVGFYRSRYRGRKCYYVDQSRNEYIFLRNRLRPTGEFENG